MNKQEQLVFEKNSLLEKELAAKNRELEIEASLERVREKAMAMRSSEELNVLIATVFAELTHLDLVLTRCVIMIYDTLRNGFHWWMANSETPSAPMNYFVKDTNLPFFNAYLKGWQERTMKWTFELEGENKIRVDDFLFTKTELSLLPDFVISGMRAPEKVFLNASFNNFGNLTLASLEPLTDEQFKIMLRFAKVFDLTYTRFNDLQNAEAQAREAQIQLALERVRAKTMAMQKPSEFVDVINIIGEQFMHLGFDFDWVNFSANGLDVSKAIDIWNFVVVPGLYQGATRLVIPFFEHPVFTKAEESVNEYYTKGNSFTVVMLDKKDKDTFLNHLFTNTIYKDLPEEVKTSQYNREVYQTSNVVLKDTWLSVGKYDATPLTDEQIGILKRLANEFGQAYTRFLDLQKAEEQAREARIEAALESVRASSMAMHHSDELENVVKTLAEKLVDLGISLDGALIFFFDKENRAYNLWIATNQLPAPLKVNYPYEEAMQANPIIQDLWKAIETGAGFLNKSYAGNVKNDYFRFTAKHNANIPEEVKKIQQEAQNWTFSFTGGKHSVIGIDSWHGKVITADEFLVLKRFATVFEQAYTRFLDLEKAEAQAREAQIEAALEKVRSRSLAMHKSDELREVIVVVFEKLKELGLVFENAGIQLFVEKSKDILQWVAAPNLLSKPILVNLPYEEKELNASEIVRDIWLAKEKNKNIFNKSYSLIEKNKFFKYAGRHNSFEQIPQQVRDIQLQAPGYTYNLVAEKHAAVWLDTYSFQNISVEDFNVLKRVAKVFEQAYTRFLDLQKAEAQAREAQIQLALERVRARTMAMHKSDELREVVAVIYEQLQQLGFVQEGSCNINIMDASTGNVDWWMTGFGAQKYPHRYHVEYINHPMHITQLAKWKSGEKYTTIEVAGESKKEFDRMMLSQADFEKMSDETKRMIASVDKVIFSMAFMKYGALSWAANPITDEQANILQRFAKVFEQTYTRFQDLQKAEAQAREAQIEAGLERVRSRAMGMQSSEELAPLIGTVFTELTKLELALTRCVIWIFDPETNGATWWMANSEDAQNPISCDLPYNVYEPYIVFLEQWKKRANNFQYELSGTIKKDWDDYLFSKTGLSRLPAIVIDGMKAPERVFLTASFNNFGALNAATLAPLSVQDLDILLRFARVFDLTYTRFNDLKQAEAQAREAQIQLALERVRARTMAMYKSEELTETAALLFQQIQSLGLPLISCGYNIWEEKDKVCDAYMSDAGGFIHSPFKIPLTQSPAFIHFYNSRQKKERFYTEQLNGEVLASHYKYMLTLPGFASIADNFLKAGFRLPEFQVNNVANFSHGNLIFITSKEVPEAEDIFMRFASVFDQSYTRFLDLQKAEAQAREAHIEAALEKVRSRTMAMRKSDELSEVAILLFNQVKSLGIKTWTTGFNVWSDNNNYYTDYITSPQGGFIEPYTIDATHFAAFAEISHARKTGEEFFVSYLEGDILKQTYLELAKFGDRRQYEIMLEGGFEFPSRQFNHFVFGSKVSLMFITYEPVPEAHDIFKRFGKVFEQTYTRFLDLQKAEAQAREAQIEAALERVRAKAMAMHNSNDVSVAASMVFSELRKLGINPIRCGVGLLNKESRKAQLYSATSSSDGDSLSLVGWVMLAGHPVLENIYDTWLKKEDYYPELTGSQLKSYYENLLAGLSLPVVPNWETGEKQYGHFFSFSVGCLYTWSERHYNEPEIKILKRFAAIIDLTFRRYLDLQKAEANAKEAQIEASLEKVRGKAMAMHTSQDLSDTIGTFYQELKSFSLTPMRCGVGLLDKEERIGEMFTWNTTEQGEGFELAGRLKMEGHNVLNNIYENWLKQREYHPVLRGDEIKEYYKVLKPQIDFPDNTRDDVLFGYFFFFQEGGVYAWTDKEMQEDELQIYRRFTSVLSLTYKRYRDLEKAESNAKEAVKQAALDRIRADIASMRTVTDLDRITPLIWNELTILGVPFIRCGVFIMDDEQQQIHTFLSTPEGKGIAAFHLPYNTPGNIAHVITHWQKKEIYTDHWDEEAFKEFADNLVKQGAMKTSEQYLSTMPAGGFNLHFVPFQQGMLYVGNVAPLGEEEINLLQSIADAFSTAYARYEDFNKLEAAKKQVDNTLTELEQAQQQLVQSEKMASLGELTAGIAHEIQNPLNFVNNFSEVNKEMLEELKTERLKPDEERDDDLQNDLINDVIENSEKILHHGKRADAIVKGMLQHSRQSSGQKEPTDINALANEYLRLSYHGMRAKDKSFNAEMKTDFDESLGKINIIPQDIGRVLLNLFNNAFYAVTEKKKQLVNEEKSGTSNLYQPTVSVSTRKSENSVFITVSDNGNGIPKNIIDKIFQPFFTTKPTGSGTGLGLSLSYDIVKAHGGKIKVDSIEQVGTEFIIELPI